MVISPRATGRLIRRTYDDTRVAGRFQFQWSEMVPWRSLGSTQVATAVTGAGLTASTQE